MLGNEAGSFEITPRLFLVRSLRKTGPPDTMETVSFVEDVVIKLLIGKTHLPLYLPLQIGSGGFS